MNKKQKQKVEPYMNIVFKVLPSMDSFLQLDPISERFQLPSNSKHAAMNLVGSFNIPRILLAVCVDAFCDHEGMCDFF